ncbi:MAG: STAS domain-containing protein [Planctomycetota bacterium]|nr:MAG: STAS domain-containing protein [Planctomycetota bacterium]
MAGLDIQFKKVPNVNGGGLAQLSGAIDGNTIQSFQKALDDIQQKGVSKLILDFSQVKYVNSTGLGSLVKYADTFKQAGGGIALMKVPAKVKIVIEMLGLNAFFEMCANLEDAIASLENGGAPAPATPSISAKPKAPSAAPTRKTTTLRPTPHSRKPTAPSAAPAATTNSPTTVFRPPSSLTTSTAPATTTAPTSTALRTTCISCNLELDIPNPGNYQCPRCFTLIAMNANGQISFQMPTQPQPVALVLHCSPACTEAFRNVVASLAKAHGFGDDAIQALQQSILEICNILSQHVYNGQNYTSYHVLIDSNGPKFTIRISDYGKPISPNLISSLFRKTQQIMTEFQCTPHPRGGNIINLAKNL